MKIRFIKHFTEVKLHRMESTIKLHEDFKKEWLNLSGAVSDFWSGGDN